MRTPTTSAALALILALTLAGCASTDTDTAESSASTSAMSKVSAASESATDNTEDDAMENGEATAGGKATAKEGAWIDRAAYDADPAKYHAAGDVVLFFNATWCPTCQATVKSLNADGTPVGLTVVSVDFDNAIDLRKQYGVTVQHTFVQVDQSGTALAKFTGSASGVEVAASTV